MKWIGLFRAIIDFMYFFSLITAVGSPVLIWFMFTTNASITIGGYLIEYHHWTYYVVVFLGFVGYLCFVRMLYLLKETAWLLSKQHLFDLKAANWLKKAGNYCIAAGLLSKVPAFVYHMFSRGVAENNSINNAYSFGYGFDTLMVIISFGFFMILTGMIIQKGIQLKQENDLMI